MEPHNLEEVKVRQSSGQNPVVLRLRNGFTKDQSTLLCPGLRNTLLLSKFAASCSLLRRPSVLLYRSKPLSHDPELVVTCEPLPSSTLVTGGNGLISPTLTMANPPGLTVELSTT